MLELCNERMKACCCFPASLAVGACKFRCVLCLSGCRVREGNLNYCLYRPRKGMRYQNQRRGRSNHCPGELQAPIEYLKSTTII